jgi:hypothetical protein
MFKEDFNSPAKVATEPKFTPDLMGLIAWLETQDGATTYDWHNCVGGCLLGMFATALGVESGFYCRVLELDIHRLQVIAMIEPHTYSAALSRARAALIGAARS